MQRQALQSQDANKNEAMISTVRIELAMGMGKNVKIKNLKPIDPNAHKVSEIISLLETNRHVLPPRWRYAETLLLLNEDERQLMIEGMFGRP